MARNTMNRFALMAGVLALTATAALAQNVKGTIPFDFTVSGKTMTAGTYEVYKMDSVAPVWVLTNLQTKQKAMAVSPATAANRPAAQRSKPALAFECAAEKCALSALYDAGNTTGRAFRVAPSRDPKVQIATVLIPLAD